MITRDEEAEICEAKANAFFKLSQPVHCKYKNGNWKRGYILEVNADFFLLNEFKDGEVPVFFIELRDIDRYVSNK